MKSRFSTTVLSVAALQLCLAGAAQAQATLPDFSGRDAWAGNYRTRIVEGLRKGPNFAGHYSLIEIGCGSSCLFAYLADARSGQVFSFPYGGEEQYELSLRYGLDSPRLVATWMRDEASCIRQDLAFNGTEFIVLGETIIPRQDFCNRAADAHPWDGPERSRLSTAGQALTGSRGRSGP